MSRRHGIAGMLVDLVVRGCEGRMCSCTFITSVFIDIATVHPTGTFHIVTHNGRRPGAAGLEFGTPPFTSIAAARHGAAGGLDLVCVIWLRSGHDLVVVIWLL